MRVQLQGTGSALPRNEVATETVADLIQRYVPDKGADWAEEKIGIRTRFFSTRLDAATGHPKDEVDELDLPIEAAHAALQMSGIPPDRIGGLWFVSCTQSDRYRHFSRACLELHSRLGLSANAFALEMDAGCGGGVHALAHASHLIAGGAAENVLIVASSLPSPYFMQWEAYAQSGAWLSLYIFGDGAGAMVLGQSLYEDRGILAAYTAVDPSVPLMSFSRAEGQTTPVYQIDGRAVALGFRQYARRAISELQRKFAFSLEQVARFYFHQVNAKVLRDFLAELEIPLGRAAIHVDRYGNLAAASLFVLIDEDIRSGVIGPGDLCLLCAVGAGAQYGAILLRI